MLFFVYRHPSFHVLLVQFALVQLALVQFALVQLVHLNVSEVNSYIPVSAPPYIVCRSRSVLNRSDWVE